MTSESKREAAAGANGALLHPAVVMVFLGFSGRTPDQGSFLTGFREFRRSAAIEEFQEEDFAVDMARRKGEWPAFATRCDTRRYHSSGRDLWVFDARASGWLALSQTVLEFEETPA